MLPSWSEQAQVAGEGRIILSLFGGGMVWGVYIYTIKGHVFADAFEKLHGSYSLFS